MKDYSNYVNPYNFAYPVKSKDQLYGREKELDEIKYYLDQAEKDSQPISISIIGQRASGKTSLLNVCEFEAKSRNLIVAKVNLDESDSDSELRFFQKIFDSIFFSVCSNGYFGGLNGKTYDIYLDMISCFQIPEEKTFCPFIFPIQFAKAISSSNENESFISLQNFINDLEKIQQEVNKQIVVLCDELNVLAHNRSHLEKLRNILQNLQGYIFIFCGTPDLFPLINDIFSPIARNFKKINISGYKHRHQTMDLINKPLENLGIDINEIIDDEFNYNDVHKITSGNPYEIKLVCHFLFKQIQEKKIQKMRLSTGIIEEVRKEIEAFQDISMRPILLKVKTLNELELKILGLFCAFENQLDFEKTYLFYKLFLSSKTEDKPFLLNHYLGLVQMGILKEENNLIKFCGDDFDKVYTKYYSMEKGINISFSNLPLFLKIEFNLIDEFFTKDIEINPVLSDKTYLKKEILDVINTINNKNINEDNLIEDSNLISYIYRINFDYRKENNFVFFLLSIFLEEKVFCVLFRCENKYDALSCKDKVEEIINQLNTRVDGENAYIKFEEIIENVIPIDLFSNTINSSSNYDLRREIAIYHLGELTNLYMENKIDSEEINEHADLCYFFNLEELLIDCNNLGYYYLANKDLDKAKNVFEKIITDNKRKEYEDSAIVFYNLGIISVINNDINDAIEKFQKCKSLLCKYKKEKYPCFCLFTINSFNEGLQVLETFEVDLIHEVENAIEITKEFIKDLKTK